MNVVRGKPSARAAVDWLPAASRSAFEDLVALA